MPTGRPWQSKRLRGGLAPRYARGMRLFVAASVALLVVAGCGGTGTASLGGTGEAAGDRGQRRRAKRRRRERRRCQTPGSPTPGPADAGFVSDLDGGPACSTPGGDGACLPYTDCGGDHAPTPGYCPGLPTDVLCCTARPFYCDPTAAPDPNAGLIEAPGDPGCPDGMARVGTFCIDRYEDALAGWSPVPPPPGPAARGPVPRGRHPPGLHLGDPGGRGLRRRGQAPVHRHRVAPGLPGPERLHLPLRGHARARGVQRPPRRPPGRAVLRLQDPGSGRTWATPVSTSSPTPWPPPGATPAASPPRAPTT